MADWTCVDCGTSNTEHAGYCRECEWERPDKPSYGGCEDEASPSCASCGSELPDIYDADDGDAEHMKCDKCGCTTRVSASVEVHYSCEAANERQIRTDHLRGAVLRFRYASDDSGRQLAKQKIAQLLEKHQGRRFNQTGYEAELMQLGFIRNRTELMDGGQLSLFEGQAT